MRALDALARLRTDAPLQGVFAGATMPSRGPRSVLLAIQAMFPGITHVHTEQFAPTFVLLHAHHKGRAHQPVSSLQQRFVNVRNDNEAKDTLADVLARELLHSPPQTIPSQATIFANSSVKVEEVADSLGTAGFSGLLIDAAFYRSSHTAVALHGGLLTEVRQRSLADFRSVALCHYSSADSPCPEGSTVHGVRGLDSPELALCVQFGFATNTIDYLHRIGRVARA
jgi:superfamily II DNA/RNA helicase